ncbi:hypothetical protein ACO0LF_14730 [Undibacterium sp. Di27W]|uniref:hypothetical protein n=1 Tax=Undibacterium sp. Di27W TaxID=3413036 RepID=UPI003BEFA4C5
MHFYIRIQQQVTRITIFAGLFFACAASVHATDPNPGDKAYYCKHSDGSQFWQSTTCDPGMELETGRVNEKGLIDSDAVAKPQINIPLPTPAEPAVEKNTAASTADVGSDKDVLKQANKSLLKLFGFGLFFGIIAKLTGRSFILWTLIGLFTRFMLVALNLLSI